MSERIKDQIPNDSGPKITITESEFYRAIDAAELRGRAQGFTAAARRADFLTRQQLTPISLMAALLHKYPDKFDEYYPRFLEGTLALRDAINYTTTELQSAIEHTAALAGNPQKNDQFTLPTSGDPEFDQLAYGWMNGQVSLGTLMRYYLSTKESYLTKLRIAEYLARHDELTGVLNRRGIEEEIDVNISKLKSNPRRNIALLFIDMADFNKVNNTFGHSVGDIVLKASVKAMLGRIREGDQAGRFGGDEFLVILSRTNLEAALKVGRRISMAVPNVVDQFLEKERPDIVDAFYWKQRIAYGATMLKPTDSVEEVCERADQDFYKNKNKGKTPQTENTENAA